MNYIEPDKLRDLNAHFLEVLSSAPTPKTHLTPKIDVGVFVVNDAVSLEEAIPALFEMAPESYKIIKANAEWRDAEERLHQVRLECLKTLQEMPLTDDERQTQVYKLGLSEANKKIEQSQLTPHDRLIGAFCRCYRDYFQNILEMCRRSWAANKLNILGTWEGEQTLIRPVDFYQWVKYQGFHLPQKLGRVFQLLEEERTELQAEADNISISARRSPEESKELALAVTEREIKTATDPQHKEILQVGLMSLNGDGYEKIAIHKGKSESWARKRRRDFISHMQNIHGLAVEVLMPQGQKPKKHT